MPHDDSIRCPACCEKAVFDMKAGALVCGFCARILEAGPIQDARDAGTGNGDTAAPKQDL